MTLTNEQKKELAQFPPVLRALIEAELAAGNTVVEVGHTHPAPPAGAYFKLANKVTTRARESGGGLDFYERNSSIYSGEFTDAKRFYWVLEPPNPPPPEPDMDAIRKSLEPKPGDPLVELANRRAGSGVEIAMREMAKWTSRTNVEKPTGVSHLLHFRDARPPHEVQFALERELMVLFTAVREEDERLRWYAAANVIGALYDFELRFVAATEQFNCYSLRIEVSWEGSAATHHDYFRKTSAGWIEMWTRDLMGATPPAEVTVTERYRALCEAALRAESHLDSVEAVQQAVIAGLKQGGRFGTSHKEGGTSIYWQVDRFVRSDYGDDPDLRAITKEDEFLDMLRRFCEWDVKRHARGTLSELETWKLILRRMYRS